MKWFLVATAPTDGNIHHPGLMRRPEVFGVHRERRKNGWTRGLLPYWLFIVGWRRINSEMPLVPFGQCLWIAAPEEQSADALYTLFSAFHDGIQRFGFGDTGSADGCEG